MVTTLVVIIVILALALTFLVLIQNSKGGGLASGFAGGNQVMGAPKTADVLEKTTWSLIAIIVLLSIFAVGLGKSDNAGNGQDSQLQNSKVSQEAIDNLKSSVETAAPAADFNEEAAQ
ncbi:MAG: preprotein translocase subunit SecG [Paludibacteraceae bacterium]|nr:preprotein translocase subunit SecG [Paludibacteraceae bacterium]MBR1480736.1 preprotein translocase subunit SecG [Paludibacteraceae bacterium]